MFWHYTGTLVIKIFPYQFWVGQVYVNKFICQSPVFQVLVDKSSCQLPRSQVSPNAAKLGLAHHCHMTKNLIKITFNSPRAMIYLIRLKICLGNHEVLRGKCNTLISGECTESSRCHYSLAILCPCVPVSRASCIPLSVESKLCSASYSSMSLQ